MLTARQENERTLARLLGISEEQAAQHLAYKVRVRAGNAAAQGFVAHLKALLGFTLIVVGDTEPADLDLAVNAVAALDVATALVACIDDKGLRIAATIDTEGRAAAGPHDLGAKLAACYAAGLIIAHGTGGPRRDRLTLPFHVAFDAFGLTPRLLAAPIDLADTVLAGAGGVGSGFVWALESLNVSGELDVADPKTVSSGNLNRCFHYGETDVGENKAEKLCANARFDSLTLTPFVGTFNELRRQRGRVKRVIVTVDSRAARRDIQKEFPLEVLDASTTDVSEVVVHSQAEPNPGACLCCIYRHIPREDEEMHAIAEGLGVTVDVIRGKTLIDAELAQELAALHGVDAKSLEGVALSSLYKQLCATQALQTAAGEQALAPFAFVSNLAGVLLAIELLRVEHGEGFVASTYASLDPWSPPHRRARRARARSADCEFCSDDGMTELMRTIWRDRLDPDPLSSDEQAA